MALSEPRKDKHLPGYSNVWLDSKDFIDTLLESELCEDILMKDTVLASRRAFHHRAPALVGTI